MTNQIDEDFRIDVNFDVSEGRIGVGKVGCGYDQGGMGRL